MHPSIRIDFGIICPAAPKTALPQRIPHKDDESRRFTPGTG